MHKKRLLWQLYPSYLLITLTSLVAVGWFASNELEESFHRTVRDKLQYQAQAIDRQSGERFTAADAAYLLQMSRDVVAPASSDDPHRSRATLVLPSGDVICETAKDEPLENHADRPEIREALAGRVGWSTRHSATLGEDMMYVAVPVRRHGQTVGVARTSLPLRSINSDVRAVQWKIATGGLVIAVLAALVSLVISRRIARPMEEMRTGAERFARGELGYKMAVPDTAEMGGLAESLNQMASQLSERIRTITRQNNEQRAVLASMVEGVLAVDTDQRVISLNKAAAQLLGNPQLDGQRRSLQEVVRNADLRRFVSQALISDESIEGDILLHGDPDRVLQAHGTALRDGGGQSIGAVIVLNDVTSFRRLENIRRDFVANVSHELKTPITSIKGFVETLLDGALHNADDAERFLRIIAKQADRLNAIIEDLLSLSKIEQSEDGVDIVLEPAPIRDVLDAALYDCQAKAQERHIDVQLQCDERLRARINAPLLEQAVVNLLDNAIKYSDHGGRILVRASQDAHEVSIAIRDEGCGIPAEHLSRIFERFYRVDKGRSRKQGGTGLGLSIVKHIVNVHHGRVTVESTAGRGSVFTIVLPRGEPLSVATPQAASTPLARRTG